MKRFILTVIISLIVFIGVIVACNIIANSAGYKTSQIEVKKISGSWVSCKKGTNKKVNYTGIAQNKHGWWRVKNGYVDFKADGIYQNDYGWWKTTDGKVTFKETGIYQNEYGWWRTEDSKVNFDANSIYQNIFGWWKTTNGKVTFLDHGVYQNKHGWWKVEDSKVNFDYNGLASNEHGTWRIVNGKVDFSYTGLFTFRGVTYILNDGKVIKVARPCNKRILFLGDSLASGYMMYGEKVNNIEKSYPNVASNYVGFTIDNLARAGESYCRRSDEFSSSYYIMNTDISKYDVIILSTGIIDYFSNYYLGNRNDYSYSTLRGAINIICSEINKANKIRSSENLPPIDVVVCKINYVFKYNENKIGYTISDYNEAICETFKEKLAVEPTILTPSVLNSKTYKSYTTDDLHPNKKGVENQAISLIEDLTRSDII